MDSGFFCTVSVQKKREFKTDKTRRFSGEHTFAMPHALHHDALMNRVSVEY